MPQKTTAPRLLHYGVAILLPMLALYLRWPLLPLLGVTVPYLLFFPAIAVSAWYGRLGPGLLATAVSGSLSSYFILPPTGSLRIDKPGDLFSLSIFLMIGVLISVLHESVHRANERIAESSAQLGQSNERFDLLVESAQDYGIFMLDANGYVTTWNVGAERINGYRAKQIIGQHFSRFYPPEDVEQGKPEKELAVATAQGRFEDEGWRVRHDGTRFWAYVTTTAMHDKAGQLRGFWKVTRDMTQRKQAEEERTRLLTQEQAARQEAEAANRAKDEFLSVLSHELRTPLTSIIGWTSLLRAGQPDAARVAQGLEIIERNATVQTKLVEDLLYASRIVAGKLTIDAQPLELAPVIKNAAETVGSAAKARGIQLHLDLATEVVVVSGDATRLEQVVWNLLSNAIKFTPAGGYIEVSLTIVGSQAQITVRDNGQGISADVLPTVFERFRQADSSSTRQHGGLGLGLTIVRSLVEAHGGTVWAASPGKGQGTTVTVQLPLLVTTQPAEVMSQRTVARGRNGYVGAAPVGTAPTDTHGDDESDVVEPTFSAMLQGLRVLAVEDDVDTLHLLRTVLAGHGATVRTASSTAEALAAVTQWKPDLLLSDIGLPGENGYALIRKVRALQEGPSAAIPAVALTAFASAADRTCALEAGYQVHLAKPIDPSDLIEVVARLVGRTGSG